MNQPTAPHYEFTAGALSLDFLNTVWERPGFLTSNPETPQELLHSYQDLLGWAAASGSFGKSWIQETTRLAHDRPSTANAAFAKALRFREDWFKLVLELVGKGRPSADALGRLNDVLGGLPSQRLTFEKDKFVFSEPQPSLDGCLEKICRDAVRVLTEEPLDRLRVCDADDCGWMFLDTSKSGRRRWCSMSDCGNRDKVRRFFERQRASEGRRSSASR
jgi:predicted RNA-binding Zn ribbon-like protein